MKRHQNLTPAPNEARTRPLCFAACIPLSLKKKQIAVSLLSVCSYQGDDTLNFVQLQFVPPRVVRLKVPRCRSVCSAGLFTVPLPGVGSRVKEWWKKQKYEDRPPSLIWTCRSVSVCPVSRGSSPVPCEGDCAEEEEGEEEGGPVSRVHRSEVARGSPRSRRGEVSARSGLGCSWIDPSSPLWWSHPVITKSAAFSLPACFARENERGSWQVKVHWGWNSVRLFSLRD